MLGCALTIGAWHGKSCGLNCRAYIFKGCTSVFWSQCQRRIRGGKSEPYMTCGTRRIARPVAMSSWLTGMFLRKGLNHNELKNANKLLKCAVLCIRLFEFFFVFFFKMDPFRELCMRFNKK